MDLSALIFVALAVAWGAYLVPKALRYHEADTDRRDVEGFSDRMRVLARRDAVSAREARLVRADETEDDDADEQDDDADEQDDDAEKAARRLRLPSLRLPTLRLSTLRRRDRSPRADRSDRAVRPSGRPTERPVLTPEERRRRRLRQAAARRAASRRRRVLLVLLAPLAVVVTLALVGVVAAVWTAVPAGVVVAWLVLCRVMVRRERAVRVRRRRTTLADEELAAEDEVEDEDEAEVDEIEPVAVPATAAPAALDDEPPTDEIPVVAAAQGWAPVPVTLPTYVAKAPAGRTVRTIDLDSTGVWSSGRSEVDSALAREADAKRAEEQAPESDERRATGS